MDNFERNLIAKFPQIDSYHDLHIWQQSSHSYVATIHIIFKSPKLYAKTIDDLRLHFHEHSIAHVTIQPEFICENMAIKQDTTNNTSSTSASSECMLQCIHPDCADKQCCKDSQTDLREISVCPSSAEAGKQSKKHNHHHHHGHSHGGHGHGHGHSHGSSHSHSYKHKNQVNKHAKVGKCKKSEHEISVAATPVEVVEKENQETEMPEVNEQKSTINTEVVQVPIVISKEEAITTVVEFNADKSNGCKNTSLEISSSPTTMAKTESSIVGENTEASEIDSTTASNIEDKNDDDDDENTNTTKC